MKRPCTLRLLLAAVAALVYVITSSATIRHTAVFDNSSVSIALQLSGSDSVSVLSWPGMLSDGTLPGAPELHGKQLKFIVPANAANFRISVKNAANGRIFELSHILQPVQQPITTNEAGGDIEPTPANPQYYTHITPLAKIADDGYADGDNHVLTLWVVPMDYEPAHNRVTCYGSLDIEIEYDEVAGISGSQRPITPAVQTTISADWRKEIANSADISRYGARRMSTQVQVPGYLIITSADLMDSFRELADWKRQKGYRVTQTCIDDILSNPRYADGDTVTGVNDDAGKMRAYLMDYYRQNGKSFVLLGGDYTKVPIRYGYYGGVDLDMEGNHLGPVPSDWYFAELNSDWDTNNNGVFGEIITPTDTAALNDALSSDPELITGRILCFKKEHVKNYIKKLILYEINPGCGNLSYLNNSFHFVHYDLRRYFDEILDSLHFANNTFLRGLASNANGAPYPLGNQVMDAMCSDYYGYISMNGHGSPTTIETGVVMLLGKFRYGIKVMNDYKNYILKDSMPTNSLDRLQNYDQPAVAYSTACTVAPFDRLDNCGDFYTEEDRNFKEEFNMASGFTCAGEWGGPAFIGNTRVGWQQESPKLHLAFISAINENPVIGIGQSKSRTAYWHEFRCKYLCITNHLIGDPEFSIWNGMPKQFNPVVNFTKEGIILQSKEFRHATVSVWDGNDNINRYLLSNGTESMTIASHAVFISKTGFLPIVTFIGSGKTITDTFPKLTVNYSALGSDPSNKFIIGNGGVFNLSATKVLQVGPGFEVGIGGTVTLQCDGDVNINGGFIQSGGKLIIRAKNITINSSFTAESGASVIIEQQ